MTDNEKPLVLIVDDNPQNLQVLGTILKENGYLAAAAQNGLQALNYTEKKTPDIVLMDMMMPQMDGLETCRRLKENHATNDIPVIFITALSDSWNKLKAFEAGGVDYITKPFMKEEVLARINVHIKLKQAIEKLENMSVTDELTGAYNRRFAYQTLNRQIDYAKRKEDHFVLCYLDINNLKTINDQYGHKSGDKLIGKVVEGLNESVRSTDYVFRMGGDEFMVLFPNAAKEEAEKVMSRIREKMNRQSIHGIPIDFSYGFAQFNAADETGLDDLIKLADTEMYEMKRSK